MGGTYKINAQVAANQATGLPLAGFWIRFVGLFVDGIIFTVFEVILRAIFNSLGLIDIIVLVVEVCYFTYFWTNSGATPGQMLVGIKVVDMDSGQNLKASQAVIRWIGMFISGLCLLIGYIWAAFDPKKQGWMDHLANTQVVRVR